MKKLLIRVVPIVVTVLFLLVLRATCQTFDEGKKKIIYLEPLPAGQTLTENDQRQALGLLQELEVRRRESAIFMKFMEQEEAMQKERDQIRSDTIKLAQDKQKFAEEKLAEANDKANNYKLLYEALLKQQKRSKGCTIYKFLTVGLGRC
jgi:hypothetical protein